MVTMCSDHVKAQGLGFCKRCFTLDPTFKLVAADVGQWLGGLGGCGGVAGGLGGAAGGFGGGGLGGSD